MHKFPIHIHVIITAGAFKDCPAFITGLTVSTATGFERPAYQVEISDQQGVERKCTVDETWVLFPDYDDQA